MCKNIGLSEFSVRSHAVLPGRACDKKIPQVIERRMVAYNLKETGMWFYYIHTPSIKTPLIIGPHTKYKNSTNNGTTQIEPATWAF